MAANVAVPNTNFTDGTPAVADQVDANFAALVAWINANAAHLDGAKAFTGLVSGPAVDPSGANHLTRKAYVDAQDAAVQAAGATAASNAQAAAILTSKPVMYIGTPIALSTTADTSTTTVNAFSLGGRTNAGKFTVWSSTSLSFQHAGAGGVVEGYVALKEDGVIVRRGLFRAVASVAETDYKTISLHYAHGLNAATTLDYTVVVVITDNPGGVTVATTATDEYNSFSGLWVPN